MTKLTATCAAAVLLGVFASGISGDAFGLASPPSAASTGCAPGVAGGGIADYYKIVRAEYVNISGNIGTLNTTCFITNTRVQPITLKEIYVLGPGGATSILATYNGFVGLSLPPLGQVRLSIDSTAIAGLIPETWPGGNGVKSVVVGWHGPADALELTSVIERHDGGSTSGRAFVSLVGVPLTL
jgi:hypothetical protein